MKGLVRQNQITLFSDHVNSEAAISTSHIDFNLIEKILRIQTSDCVLDAPLLLLHWKQNLHLLIRLDADEEEKHQVYSLMTFLIVVKFDSEDE